MLGIKEGSRTLATALAAMVINASVVLFCVHKGITDFVGLAALIGAMSAPALTAMAYKSVQTARANANPPPPTT